MEKIAGRKLALIGAMGSGKSRLARRYTERYGGTVFDTDAEFTRRYGAISDFFSNVGEVEFRRIEQELMIEAARSGTDIISLGGGAVLNKKGMCAIRASYDIVYLYAPAETLYARIRSTDRPLKNRLDETLRDRKPLYEKNADYSVDSTVDSLSELEKVIVSPRRKRYDIVLCDSDDTLLDFRSASAHSIAETVRALGLNVDEDEAVRVYAEANNGVWKMLERGELDRDGLFKLRAERFGAAFGLRIDPQSFNDAYCAAMGGTMFVSDGATEFLQKIKARGLSAYIITNSFTMFAKNRLKPLLPYVDGSFVSEEVGYYKPDARYFEAVLSALGNPDRSRVIIFGDGETSDIAGGVSCGIDCCLYDRSGAKETAAEYSVKTYDEFLRLL